MVAEITKRQRQVYDIIVKHREENGGVSPEFSELAEELKVKSVSTVHEHVSALIDAGMLETGPGNKGYRPTADAILLSHSGAIVKILGGVIADSRFDRFLAGQADGILSEMKISGLDIS